MGTRTEECPKCRAAAELQYSSVQGVGELHEGPSPALGRALAVALGFGASQTTDVFECKMCGNRFVHVVRREGRRIPNLLYYSLGTIIVAIFGYLFWLARR